MSKEFNPDWAAIPPAYKWAAVDRDGSAWAFESEPRKYRELYGWHVDGPETAYLLGFGFDATNWKNSLCQRPTL